MTSSTPVPPRTESTLRVAVIGLGGYAQIHHRAFHVLESEGRCRLIAACDPKPDDFAEARAQFDFEGRGVRVYDDYRALLDAHRGALDLVTLPTPIPLHAEMHRACVDRGLTAYLEKPPSLDLEEFAGMLDVERRAVRATAIGFQFMADPVRLALKERIAHGEFGRVRRVSFLGLWPRSDVYYRRNNWAGRLEMNGRLVLDSCIGNAMAHYLNTACHWAGDATARSWASVESAEAELYRAHPIEGADTVFVRGRFAGGAELRIAASHACDGPARQIEVVECERATVRFRSLEDIRVVLADGTEEILQSPERDVGLLSIRGGADFAAGQREQPPQALPESEPFVHLNALIYTAARHIHTVAPPYAAVTRGPKGDLRVAVEAIAETAETMIREGRLPSEQTRPWAAPGGAAVAADTARLREIATAMAAERAAERGFRAY